MKGTQKQRLDLAIQMWGRSPGISSDALIRTLVCGLDDLEDHPKWGMCRPHDWSDVNRNLETFERLPSWAREQAVEIICESVRLVHEAYPNEAYRDRAQVILGIRAPELPTEVLA